MGDLLKPDTRTRSPSAAILAPRRIDSRPCSPQACRRRRDIDKAADAGLDYFAKLEQAGYFVPVDISASSLLRARPRSDRWDYLALADRDNPEGEPPPRLRWSYPRQASSAGVYVQAISAYAPIPMRLNCGWNALFRCVPTDLAQRLLPPDSIPDLVKSGKVSSGPSCQCRRGAYDKAIVPDPGAAAASKETITKKWDSVVGGDVK